MDGGAGSDVFRFEAGSGQDTIGDFTDGVDQIYLGSSLGINFGDLPTLDALVQTDATTGDAYLDFSATGDRVDLVGVTKAQLDWSDFIQGS